MAWLVVDTSIGPCGLAWSDAGLTHVQLPEGSREATVARLLERAPDAGDEAAKAPAWVAELASRLRAHLAGEPQDFADVALAAPGATPFVRAVRRALAAVPPGRTVTYGELARAVGSPGASRAVGRAMATNPMPVVVPCHRVVASGGAPGGFSAFGGLVTKDRLLAIEGGALSAQASLFASVAPSGSPRARRATAPKRAADPTALPYDGRAAVRHLLEADPVLARHIDATGPLRLARKATEGTFAALAESIVYQQLSGKAAATIFGRVRALFPGGALDPARLASLDDDALRAAGLSRGKLASLKDLAARALAGEIPEIDALSAMDDDAIVERLTRVRGVGRWTVEMILIFRLGRPDVLPLGDYGVRKGFARVFRNLRSKYGDDGLPSPELLERRGERWRPFRSVASWYLWRALDT